MGANFALLITRNYLYCNFLSFLTVTAIPGVRRPVFIRVRTAYSIAAT